MTWTVVLRCHDCKRRFSVAGVSIDRIALIPQATPCDHCRAKSAVSPGFPFESKLHQIIDLRKDGLEQETSGDG